MVHDTVQVRTRKQNRQFERIFNLDVGTSFHFVRLRIHIPYNLQRKRTNCASKTYSTQRLISILPGSKYCFVYYLFFFLSFLCMGACPGYIDIGWWAAAASDVFTVAWHKSQTAHESFFPHSRTYIYILRSFSLSDIQKHLNIDNARENDKHRAFRFISLHSFPFVLTRLSCIRNQ